MDREKPPLNPALKDLANRERRNLGPHPTPEQLADYHAGKLSAEEEEERIQEHLALCPECAELYLDLVDFAGPEPARDVSGLTDEEVDAAWQKMRARLGGPVPQGRPAEAPEVRVPRAMPEPVPEPPPEPRSETPVAPTAGTVVPLQRPERARPSRVYQSLAAMFLLTTLGAGFWGLSLQRQLREPRVMTARMTLSSGDSSVRSGGEKLPSSRDWTAVALLLGGLPENARYDVELRDADGDVLRTWREVSPNEGLLQFSLPSGSLAPGDYRFHVSGLGEGAGKEAKYPFTIEQ